MFDIVSVGHCTIDSILLPSRQIPIVVFGGSAVYVSLSARRLDRLTSIVTKVGDDFPKAYLWLLEQEAIDLSGVVEVQSEPTTQFELRYNHDLTRRKLRLKGRAPPITVEDLPRTLNAKVIHVAPVADEITFELAEKLRSCADWLSLDPQGLVRNFDEKGNASQGSLTDKRILRLVDIYKSSSREIKAATGISNLHSAIKAIHEYGVGIVIVTLGRKGAILSAEETTYNIPACKSEKLVDPTGAGDVFIGSFLAEHVGGESLLWCACVGSAAASLAIEAVGPTSFGDKKTIFRRAHVLYEKEIKQ